MVVAYLTFGKFVEPPANETLEIQGISTAQFSGEPSTANEWYHVSLESGYVANDLALSAIVTPAEPDKPDDGDNNNGVCQQCDGTGRSGDGLAPCGLCNGTGKTASTETKPSAFESISESDHKKLFRVTNAAYRENPFVEQQKELVSDTDYEAQEAAKAREIAEAIREIEQEDAQQASKPQVQTQAKPSPAVPQASAAKPQYGEYRAPSSSAGSAGTVSYGSAGSTVVYGSAPVYRSVSYGSAGSTAVYASSDAPATTAKAYRVGASMVTFTDDGRSVVTSSRRFILFPRLHARITSRIAARRASRGWQPTMVTQMPTTSSYSVSSGYHAPMQRMGSNCRYDPYTGRTVCN